MGGPAPLAGLASLGLGPGAAAAAALHGHGQPDWDQLSMYSQRTDRSVPRARMYHMEGTGKACTPAPLAEKWSQGNTVTLGSTSGYIPEDARSHLSAMSVAAMSAAGRRRMQAAKSRSIGDLTGKGSTFGSTTMLNGQSERKIM